jgi:mRNA interferase RelE/StbE|tara:strand:- start:672 stop:944 length:273 start_codon:yes stop_codon:yes gene_type:complete
MLDISRSAHKFLDKLQQPKHYKQIASKILSLLKNPKPSDSKHLSGYSGYFRVDSGEYRIIYTITNLVINVVLVGKRNDDEVYKKMSRTNA